MPSEKTKFRTAYGPKQKSTMTFNDPSLAKQAFRDECDINNILSRFEKTQTLEHLNQHEGRYGDFINVQSYQDSLNQVMAAQSAFDTLPSRLRKMFDNDPEKFLEFATNPDNEEALIKMGLAPRPEAPPSPEVPITPETPPEAPTDA